MSRFKIWLPLSLFAIFALSLAGCTLLGGGTKTPPVFGSWNYSMDNSSQGTMTGAMTLQQEEDGSYTGRISAVEAGINDVLRIESLEIEGPVFRLHGVVSGNEFKLNGTVDGDTMSGTNDVIGLGVFKFTATRAEEK